MKNLKLIKSGLVPALLAVVITISMSSCVSVFFPQKQKVTFNTGNKEATLYIDKTEAGKGTLVTEKIEKNGAHQVIVKAPGYKDNYAAIVQTHRAWGFWVCMVLDLPFFYGLCLDPLTPKGMSYDDMITVKSEDKLVNRNPTDKYIDISNIRLDIKNTDKDITFYYITYSKDNLLKDIENAEKKKDDKETKAELKKLNKKNKKNKLEDPEENKLKYDDTKFSYNVYKTLKSTGYVDTINKVFSDNNNTLVLEGSIKKVNIYYIFGKRALGHYYKTKLFLRWYIKNTYNEILDSLDTKEYSGDFVIDGNTENNNNTFEKMFGDAVDISYLKLNKDGKLVKYMKQETNFKTSDPLLSIPSIKSVVTEKGDAAEASVIVKTKDGHGSGFAISQNGYIITNYHVIAGKYSNKPNSFKIITSSGEEVEGTLVRYNKFRDLALIKVNKSFDKAFKISNVKSFKSLQDVYTIGAPKSVELGQSVSAGVISNERKSNNNYLLQLGMSVNGGNSGGPVFDAQGNLHGVVVSKLVGQNTEGVSFAIPGFLIQDYLNINYK